VVEFTIWKSTIKQLVEFTIEDQVWPGNNWKKNNFKKQVDNLLDQAYNERVDKRLTLADGG